MIPLIEFIKKAKDFGTEAERIKFFGCYLHVHRKLRRFKTAQLRECYDEVHAKDPESFNPFFQPMERRNELLKDREGYYFERRVIDDFIARYGDESPTAPVSAMLLALPGRVADEAERSFIEEAITCIRAGAPRAAIVLGWCAVIDQMRRKIEEVGFDVFNAASTKLKNSTTGNAKRWTKGVQAHSQNDLLAIFDDDLMIVLEGMGLLDENEVKRLRILFQWRCQSAHPAGPYIGDSHVVTFFTDAVEIVLANKKFQITPANPANATAA
jgi:hypothetical protein